MSIGITVDMRSLSASGQSVVSDNKSAGRSLESRIAALKQKLVDLFEELKQASQERTPKTVDKIKMIQMQIQVTQAQIMQLEAMQQQKLQNEQRAKREDNAINHKVAIDKEPTFSRKLDTYI
ncbi:MULTISPECIES: FlxA-like family protein [unclassified Methylophaga]|jgi:hypothetical protein|uniref:FlxA-like family protein n=1 Tax=unclassified Methylophaga TaxID=2629249 RepID=UPI000C973223|nr:MULTISPECIES: FlxA-like family protein [unclassified Methylophaga]MAK67651.1 hypothetical protein [Methylophaga sp.]MAY18885.1 hypothetical protein [Methylophaga sp.]HAO24467.1 hypothetical protein [Methylophaga sp.]HCD05127.1 hypothetical protein [Methylophaga sp.]|tara:strand:+ start:32712 stop:33077 length:366 start_codon:yes stop_codon:yes gene_type:complete